MDVNIVSRMQSGHCMFSVPFFSSFSTILNSPLVLQNTTLHHIVRRFWSHHRLLPLSRSEFLHLWGSAFMVPGGSTKSHMGLEQQHTRNMPETTNICQPIYPHLLMGLENIKARALLFAPVPDTSSTPITSSSPTLPSSWKWFWYSGHWRSHWRAHAKAGVFNWLRGYMEVS